jgi:hypothetical protein
MTFDFVVVKIVLNFGTYKFSEVRRNVNRQWRLLLRETIELLIIKSIRLQSALLAHSVSGHCPLLLLLKSAKNVKLLVKTCHGLFGKLVLMVLGVSVYILLLTVNVIDHSVQLVVWMHKLAPLSCCSH